jgi:hypothetical protein
MHRDKKSLASADLSTKRLRDGPGDLDTINAETICAFYSTLSD